MKLTGCVRGIALFGALALSACGGSAATAPSATSPSKASAISPASAPSMSAVASKASSSAAAPGSPTASKASSAAPASSAGSLTKISVAYSSPSAPATPVWLAQEAGIYQKHGLDVELKLITGGSTTTSSVIGGDVQLVMGGGSEALSAAASGADLLIVAVTSPTYTVVLEVPPDVHAAADLKGKTIAVPAIGGTMDIATRVGLRSLDIDPDKDVHITALGSVPAQVAAMAAGAVQGGVVNVPDNLVLEAKGWHVLLNLATANLPAANNCVYTLRSYAASHRQVVQSYVDSIVESIRIKKDKAATINTFRKYLKLDDEKALNATYDFFSKGVFPPLPYPKADYFADAKTLVGKQNPKVLTFDVNSILDSSFIQDAANRGLDKA